MKTLTNKLVFLLVLLSLASCGGGSESKPTSPNTNPPPENPPSNNGKDNGTEPPVTEQLYALKTTSAPASASFLWTGETGKEGEWTVPVVDTDIHANADGKWVVSGLPSNTDIVVININMRQRAPFKTNASGNLALEDVHCGDQLVLRIIKKHGDSAPPIIPNVGFGPTSLASGDPGIDEWLRMWPSRFVQLQPEDTSKRCVSAFKENNGERFPWSIEYTPNTTGWAYNNGVNLGIMDLTLYGENLSFESIGRKDGENNDIYLDLVVPISALADGEGQPRNASDNKRIATRVTATGVGRTDTRLRQPHPFVGKVLQSSSLTNQTNPTWIIDAQNTLTDPKFIKKGYWSIRPTLEVNITTGNAPSKSKTWVEATINDDAKDSQSAHLGWLMYESPDAFQEPLVWFMDQAADGYVASWDRAKFPEFDINTSAHMLPHQDTVLYRTRPDGKLNPISLAPFVPRIAVADRRAVAPLLYELDFSGVSKLTLELLKLDDAGTNPTQVFKKDDQKVTGMRFNHARNKTARSLSEGGVHITDIAQLELEDAIEYHRFTESGRYQLKVTGTLQPINGSAQSIEQSINFIVADHGITPVLSQLPMMPMLIGTDPMLSLQTIPPRPATVTLTWKHSGEDIQNIADTADNYGRWISTTALNGANSEGEYRLDLILFYRDPSNNALYAASRSMASVVAHPETEQSEFKVRGQRFFDNILIDFHSDDDDEYRERDSARRDLTWFRQNDVSNGNTALGGYVVGDGHVFNTYHGGDILWIQEDQATVMTASLEKLPNAAENYKNCGTGELELELAQDSVSREQTLMTCWPESGVVANPLSKNYGQTAGYRTYMYGGSERYTSRVREGVGDRFSQGYWRFDDSYGLQRGMGISGDHPDELKAQYIGLVYEDFSGNKMYAASASAFVLTGKEFTNAELNDTRVQPPFTDDALLHFNGTAKDAALWPSSIIPGDIIKQGTQIAFTGQMLPPTNIKLPTAIKAPDGTVTHHDWQANRIGYIRSGDEIDFSQAGVWTITPKIDVSEAIRSDGSAQAAQIKANINDNPLLALENSYKVFVMPTDSNGSAKLPLLLENENAWKVTDKPGPWVNLSTGLKVSIDKDKLPQDISIERLHHVAFMDGWIIQQGDSDKSSVSLNLKELGNIFRTLDVNQPNSDENHSDLIRITLFAEGKDDNNQSHYFYRALTLHGQELLLD